MDKNTIETLRAFGTFAAVIGGIIGLASIMPEEDPKERKRRLKREAAEADRFRRSQAKPDQWNAISDVIDIMTLGRRSSHSIAQELIAIKDDRQTVELYDAYKREGVKFTESQKARIRMSMDSRSQRGWIY
tara:strand:- start:3411 stop:3803 length:393 start_codon:yes stop_codon:yes gene_type:complete